MKHLFAVSGNQCAFPNCKTTLVDVESRKVTGRICHIKAHNPGGKRYDPNQSAKECHAFDNLVLMCPIHHDVIDADEVSYTVERLREIKATHEAKHQGGSEPSDDIVQQFMQTISNTIINDGSVIFSQGQMGGQIAHNITNIGPQPRRISGAAASQLVAELRKLAPEEFQIRTNFADTEAFNLAQELSQVLSEAGWHRKGEITQVFNAKSNPISGIAVGTTQVRPSTIMLRDWFLKTLGTFTGELNPEHDPVIIWVGTNL